LVKASGDVLERITLRECRHTFASLMIAAGVNATPGCFHGQDWSATAMSATFSAHCRAENLRIGWVC
jgi:hypothetical protein